MAEGMSIAQAAEVVGIHRRTATAWRNGYKKFSAGRVYEIAPVLDAPKVKAKEYSPRYLSEEERLRLADLRREPKTQRQIALLMGRSPSTISRELRRGSDRRGRYRPFTVHSEALQRRRVHRPSRLSSDGELADWVSGKLLSRWSPQQISHELRRRFADQPHRWLCTETIYQAVYRPDLGGLPRELPGQVLRRRRRQRFRRRHANARRSGPIVGHLSIHERPVEALDRRIPGAWEGDLIVGRGNRSAIVTLVERSSRYTLLGHLAGDRHDATVVRDAVVAALAPLPLACGPR
jgi:IS30 family transposase